MPSTVTCLFGRKKSGGSGAEEDKRTLMRTDCSCDSGLNVRGGSDLTLDVRCCGGDGVWGGRKRGLGEGYDNWSCSASVQALAESAPPAVVAVRQPEIPPSQSSRFIFVLAGDMEETQRLDEEISTLCQQLYGYGVPYVVVKSTSDWPLENLPPHIRVTLQPLTHEVQSIEGFVSQCFRKAAKVLMMISPGYLLYADEYTKGAEKAASPQQRRIRRYHELLKTEFFDKKREVFRIWPVLLGRLKANRVHVPTFLSSTVFYSFPQQNGSDNLMELLRLDLEEPSAG